MGGLFFEPFDQSEASFASVENDLDRHTQRLKDKIEKVIGASVASSATSEAPIDTGRDLRRRAMRVTIERKPRMYTTWFGLGSQKQSGTLVEISMFFTEEQKEIIKRAALGSHVIYEYPIDQEDYARWQTAREKWLREGQGAGGVLGSCKTYPGAKLSLVVSKFLEAPTQTVEPRWNRQDDFHLMAVEKEVEKNIRDLKGLIDAVIEHPTGKRTIEL